jgi:hypothetical protein
MGVGMTRKFLREAREWERRFFTDRKFREVVMARGGKKIRFRINNSFLESASGRRRTMRPFGRTAPEARAIFAEVYTRQTAR